MMLPRRCVQKRDGFSRCRERDSCSLSPSLLACRRFSLQLTHDVVHTLCGRPVDYEAKYMVGEESTIPVLALVDALQREFVRSISLGWSESEIASALQDRGAPEATSRVIATALQARAPELASALEGRGRPIASGRVRDFDWSLRVRSCVRSGLLYMESTTIMRPLCFADGLLLQMIMSSSTAADMLEPVLVLTLFTLDARGEEKRVLLELTKEDVDCILEDMDRIAELVDSITDE